MIGSNKSSLCVCVCESRSIAQWIRFGLLPDDECHKSGSGCPGGVILTTDCNLEMTSLQDTGPGGVEKGPLPVDGDESQR